MFAPHSGCRESAHFIYSGGRLVLRSLRTSPWMLETPASCLSFTTFQPSCEGKSGADLVSNVLRSLLLKAAGVQGILLLRLFVRPKHQICLHNLPNIKYGLKFLNLAARIENNRLHTPIPPGGSATLKDCTFSIPYCHP
jgi:hypothetical protein